MLSNRATCKPVSAGLCPFMLQRGHWRLSAAASCNEAQRSRNKQTGSSQQSSAWWLLHISGHGVNEHSKCSKRLLHAPSIKASPKPNDVDVQVAKMRMQLWASFLNNSSSRWEAIFDNWQFSLAVMDHISPIYRSDFMRCAPEPPEVHAAESDTMFQQGWLQ